MRYAKIISLVGLLVLFLYIGSFCLLPPTSKDALVHHLAVPKLYVNQGEMYEIPFMPYSYYPMNVQLLYLVALYFHNDIIPKFIHFSFALLVCYILYILIKSKIDKNIAIISITMFLSLPIVVKLSSIAYVDLGLLFFYTASLFFLIKWVDCDFRIRYLICSAIFCGLAMGTKYNGLVIAFIFALFVPFTYNRLADKRTHKPFKPVVFSLIFISISMALFSPYMIRNCAWKENPIYPLYDGWFQRVWSTESPEERPDAAETGSASEIGLFAKRRIVYGESGWEIALLPIRVFFQGRDGDPQQFDGRLNPFLLILPFFAFVGDRREVRVVRYEKRLLLIIAVVYFLIALFTREMRVRYLLPIVPPLVLLSAFGLRNIVQGIRAVRYPARRRFGWAFLWGAMLFFAGWNAWYMKNHFRAIDPAAYLTGRTDRETFLERRVPEYPALRYINTHLPPDSKILFLFLGNRGYYCDRPYVLDPYFQLYRTVKSARRPDDVLHHLREMGITHLLIRYDLFDRWKGDPHVFSGQEVAILDRFLRTHTQIMFSRRSYAVFRLT